MTTAQRIYLDNAATTPMADEVIEAMVPMMREHYGNPSSTHAHGRKVRGIIEEARGTVAKLLNCAPGEIFFTSGGTEADNLALRGSVAKLGVQNIISSAIEHHAVLHTVEELHQMQNIGLDFVKIDEKGHVDMQHLGQLLQQKPHTLVSLMHAHKFNGPKGCGFIYINKKNKIVPQITGGAQEREMRGGTENVIGIVGLAKALEIAYRDIDAKKQHITQLKTAMMDLLRQQIPGVSFNGDPEGRSLYTVLSVSLPPNDMSSMLLFQLDLAGISCSGGSACSSGATGGSHVINSIHPGTDRSTVRFSFGKHNTLDEIQYTVNQLATWYGNKA